jgi:phospho-N-acetylmuramoyl-pentapeptide-transferase
VGETVNDMKILTLFTFNVVKILTFSALSAILAFALAPLLIRFLNKIQFWKKEARTKTITNDQADVFHSLHKEREVRVPRGGGLLIWLSVLILIILFFGLSFLQNPWWLEKFNFLSRKETWLPLFALVAGSIVGLLDDALTVYGKGKYTGGGMSFLRRIRSSAMHLSLRGIYSGTAAL